MPGVNRALLPYAAAAMHASTLAAIAERELTAAGGVAAASRLSLAGVSVAAPGLAAERLAAARGAAAEPWEVPAAARSLGLQELLGRSSFVLALAAGAAGDGGGGGGGVALWGHGDYRSLAGGAEHAVDWSGGLLSLHLGADLRVVPELLAGVAVSWSQGGFDYTDRSDGAAASGEYATELIGVYPYASWSSPGIGVELWAMAGYGWGEVAITAAEDAERTGATRLLSAALGGSGRLLATERLIAGSTTLLRLKGAGEVVRIEVAEEGPITAQELDTRRLRVALEGSHAQRLAGGGRLTPVLEAGLRYDDGAGAAGAGLELRGELRYAHPELGLTVAGHGRLLATHQARYEEWAAGGLVRVELGADRRGLSLRVAPSWGSPASAAEALSEQGATTGRLDAEVGYGLGWLDGQGVLTPYGGVALAGEEARDYRAGARLELEAFHLALEGRRREHASGTAEHGLTLRGGLRY